MMPEGVFHYYGSANPVRVGDRILVSRWFGRARLATVVYIPGQSEPDEGLGKDQWAFKVDDAGIYAVGYSPRQIADAGKGIRFVSRAGQEAEEVIRSYRIPPEVEDKGQPGRDLLAFIGCGTIIAIVLVLCIVAWQKIMGAL